MLTANLPVRDLLHALDRNHRLSQDVDFFCKILRLPREALVQTLLWEANRFRPGAKRFHVFGAAKELQNKERKYFWSELPHRVLKLATDIEKAEGSSLAPSKTIFYRYDQNGNNTSRLLPPAQQAETARTFQALPAILRCWARECERKARLAFRDFSMQRQEQSELRERADSTGIEERIFEASGKYHLTRLWRLLDASAQVMGFHLINERAFVIRLNRQRKRGSTDHPSADSR